MLVALILNNVVDDIVTTNTDQDYADAVQGYQAGIDITNGPPGVAKGWLLQGNKLVPPTGPSPINWQITKLALRERFTLGEMEGIYVAEQTNPIIQILQDNLAVATFIDLSRADTIQGIEALVAYGLITPQRCAIILTTIPTPQEQYIPQ